MVRVLFVINSLAGGGAERVMTTLLRGSRAQAARHDCALALLDREEDAYTLPDWLPVHRLDCRHGLRRSITQLNALVARERPDVALSFLTRANVALAATMAPRRRPFVISERVNTTAHLGTGMAARVSKAMVRLAYPRADAIIAVSQGVADTLVSDFGVKAERNRVIPNPVDLDSIAALAARAPAAPIAPPYVVAMGRLVPNKNFALAIRAFAQSETAGRLVILGQGPEHGALRALGDSLGLGERLVMPGFADNPYAILAGARALILSSNAEGFPNALVEALATGIPAVATDCRSGPAEVLDVPARPAAGAVVAGRGGLLVPVDDGAAMAEALRRIAVPEERERLARLGQARVRDFGVERAVTRYWDVIEAALASARR
jgi:N-acetylgalactosamine-N,N'-diacetylbacillosaminyl-diphospho-undecaprenol 4-alpha-N-acetylgalactosaminyltransferase